MNTSTNKINTEQNDRNNFNPGLENRIQTNWQLMLIILAVLIILTSTYVGKCVYRHWTSRNVRVTNINTAEPDITLRENDQIMSHYEQVQDAEYNETVRYLTAASDDMHDDGDFSYQNAIPEKTNAVSNNIMVEQTQDKSLSGQNFTFENQPDKKETNDLYITPCM